MPDITSVPDADLAQYHLQTLSDDELKQIASPSSLQSELSNLQKGGFQGMVDIGAGGAQLLEHGLRTVAPNTPDWGVDQYIANQEKNPTGSGPAFNTGRFVGNAVTGGILGSLVPGAAAETMLPRVLSNFAGGALTGSLQPVDPSDPNYWTTKAKEGGAGAAAGAIAAPVAGAAARVISPNTNPNVKLLLNEGVTPTAGQIVGGWFKDLEDKIGSIKGVGDLISGAKARAVGDLNAAAANRALSHIGEKLDSGTLPGHAMIDQMHGKISDAFEQLKPNLTWQPDPQFVQNVTAIRQNATLLPLPEQQAKFDAIVKGQFSKVKNGVLDGETYKGIESNIGQEANGYIHSANADDRNVGKALLGVQGELRDALVRSNPQYGPQLANINAAYADSKRVIGAAASQGAKEGKFSAPQLSAAVRSQDPSLGKGDFARGQARMQDLSDAGKAVLGYDVPDSGTAGRLLAAGLLGAGEGGIAHLAQVPPKVLIPMLAAQGAGVAAYTRPGQATLAALLARRPDVAAPIASVVRNATPLATSGLAGVLARNAAGP